MKKIVQIKDIIIHLFRLAWRKLEDPYYQGKAAELAFYFLLSIFPILILVSQVLGIFSISLDSVREWINVDMIEVEGANMILSMLEYSPSGANSTFLGVTAVWAASRAQFSLMRITNYILTDGHSTGEGYLRDRFRSLKTVLITITTIVFALVILVYGEMLLKLIFDIVVEEEMGEKTWMIIRWPIAFALYFLMISYNYYVLPTHTVPFKAVIPGSIFASIGFVAGTGLYTMYTGVAANYDILYGSFSNIVALMFWFYVLSWIMFLGVVINKVVWELQVEEEFGIGDDEL